MKIYQMMRSLRFCGPLAMTREAYELAVAMSPAAKSMGCDYYGRVYDLLFMASNEAHKNHERCEMLFTMIAVAPDHTPEEAETGGREITLKLMAGPDDEGWPVMTIMLPDQD